jgi:hypothetical protein
MNKIKIQPMQVQFVRMIQFTRLVKADGRLREFNFRKVKSPDEELFSVNVCTDRGDRIVFNMQKKESSWRIVSGQLPQWILQNENNLDEGIKDELKSR